MEKAGGGNIVKSPQTQFLMHAKFISAKDATGRCTPVYDSGPGSEMKSNGAFDSSACIELFTELGTLRKQGPQSQRFLLVLMVL